MAELRFPLQSRKRSKKLISKKKTKKKGRGRRRSQRTSAAKRSSGSQCFPPLPLLPLNPPTRHKISITLFSALLSDFAPRSSEQLRAAPSSATTLLWLSARTPACVCVPRAVCVCVCVVVVVREYCRHSRGHAAQCGSGRSGPLGVSHDRREGLQPAADHLQGE